MTCSAKVDHREREVRPIPTIQIPLPPGQSAPDADEVWVEFNVTEAVDDWVNGSEATPNHGLIVRFPDSAPNGGVVFSSREGDFAPQLVVDYAPPASLTIPVDADSIELDDLRFVSLRWLRKLKEAAGRHKDLDDLEHLPSS